jgi:tetratricopeptide (TPR) repeat protein
MPKQTSKEETSTQKPAAKVIAMHSDKEIDEKQTVLQQAAAAEKNDNLELAEQLYNKQIQQKAFNAQVYTRLMIVLRKQKKYKEELAVIDKALKHFKEDQEKRITSKTKNAVIKRLSKSLNKSLGLTDKKGNFLFEPEPIPAWRKRKTTVEKRLKKK